MVVDVKPKTFLRFLPHVGVGLILIAMVLIYAKGKYDGIVSVCDPLEPGYDHVLQKPVCYNKSSNQVYSWELEDLNQYDYVEVGT